MPSVCVRELRPRLKTFRIFLLILFLPICLLMLFCAMYSTYLTVETWNCGPNELNQTNESGLNDSGLNAVKCFTILDAISGQLSKYITERKILLIIRTASLINTLSTYMSAWVAAYRLAWLPLVWLSMVSIASFFVTLNFTILYGPMTGINNFELVPIFIGVDLNPTFVTSVVLLLDLTIAVIAILLVMNSYKKRNYQ